METSIHAAHKMHKVYQVLKLTFGLVPIIAGLDKFTNLLTNWEKYLNPAIADMLPFSATTFMMIVGFIEIAAGLLVLAKPAIGAYVVMAWLACIGFSLLATQEYLDVAVRDFVMAIGAYSLGQISRTSAATNRAVAPNQEMAFSTP